MTPYDVVGIGNALIDIQTRIDDERLAALGYAKGLMTLSSTEEQQRLLEALDTQSFETCSGGSAANTLHGLATLGARAYHIGRVTDDAYGRLYAADMASRDVGFTGTQPGATATGTSVVLITPDAQRTMVTHLGSSTDLNPEDVDDAVTTGARFAYVEGYLWTGDATREAAWRLARAARKQNAGVAFTLSDGFIVDGFQDAIHAFLAEDVDVLFCNELEARAMAGTAEEGAAFDHLLTLCPTVFMTRGAEGAWAGRRGEDRVSVRGYPVDAIDTTGAGDLFAAGAMKGLLDDRPLRDCAILGCYCASQVITQLGARLPDGVDHDVARVLAAYEE